MGWFIWLSGNGPLVQTANDSVAFVYADSKTCAYAVGGTKRATLVPTETAQNKWTFLAVTKTELEASLWLNEGSQTVGAGHRLTSISQTSS